MAQLKIATVNTHEARALTTDSGLNDDVTSADILTLQELLGIPYTTVEERLGTYGFSLVNFSAEMGLGIAVRNDGFVTDTITTLNKQHSIHEPNYAEIAAKKLRLTGKKTYRMRQRGLLTSNMIVDDKELTIATTHPIVFPRFIARRHQLRKMGDILSSPAYSTCEHLILTGDMNHYPGPRKIDNQIKDELDLTRVTFEGKTWPIQGSKHEIYARIGGVLLGRELSDFNANLDSILYRGVNQLEAKVSEIASDHRALVALFEI